MNAKKKLAALVINWNGAEDTLDLLESLSRCHSDEMSITTVVIDNASMKRDRLLLEAGMKRLAGQIEVIYRANTVNIGVPAAYNQAIQIAGLTYDFYLRLDNDVVVESEGLAAMISALERRQEQGVAIVGGNVRYFDRKAEHNGGAVSIDLVRGKTRVSYPKSDIVCDGVLGCIMLVDGDLVRRYVPEVFQSFLFICTDESELSLRAARDGLKTLYVATLIGFHKSGRSTGKVRFLSNYYSARNWTLLRLKYLATTRQRTSVLLRIPVEIARSVVRGRWAFPWGVAAGIGLAASCFLDRNVRDALR